MSEVTKSATAAASEPAKVGAIESFMSGCKKGVHVCLDNIIPAMVLGYVIIQLLTLTGLIDLLSVVCGPHYGILRSAGQSCGGIYCRDICQGFRRCCRCQPLYSRHAYSCASNPLRGAKHADGHFGWPLCTLRTRVWLRKQTPRSAVGITYCGYRYRSAFDAPAAGSYG